jgi:hypothetical protein
MSTTSATLEESAEYPVNENHSINCGTSDQSGEARSFDRVEDHTSALSSGQTRYFFNNVLFFGGDHVLSPGPFQRRSLARMTSQGYWHRAPVRRAT